LAVSYVFVDKSVQCASDINKLSWEQGTENVCNNSHPRSLKIYLILKTQNSGFST